MIKTSLDPLGQFSEGQPVIPEPSPLDRKTSGAAQLAHFPPAQRPPLSPARVNPAFNNPTVSKINSAAAWTFKWVVKPIFFLLAIVTVAPAILLALSYYMEKCEKQNKIDRLEGQLARKLMKTLNASQRRWDSIDLQNSEIHEKKSPLLEQVTTLRKLAKTPADKSFELKKTLQSIFQTYDAIVSSESYLKFKEEHPNDPLVVLVNEMGRDLAPLADGMELYEQLDGGFCATSSQLQEDEPPVVPVRKRTLSEIEIPVKNDRDGGHKYHQAIIGLRFSLENFLEQSNQTMATTLKNLEKRIIENFGVDAKGYYQSQIRSSSPVKNFLLLDLYCIIRALNDEKSDVRARNRVIVEHLRNGVESKNYQMQKNNPNSDVELLQHLCLAKYTEIHPYESFKQLVDSAAKTKPGETSRLRKDSVGKTISHLNGRLEEASDDFRKSGLALKKQKLQGAIGVNNDPAGTSNVPYLRSEFTMNRRKIGFCRFGTPTIQKFGFDAKIDPIFLGALDALENQNKQFLYVNHQKPDHIFEGRRVKPIAELEKSRKNFHYLSIPLDGPITKEWIGKTKGSFEDFKTTILDSFLTGKNGCQLPAGIAPHEKRALLETVLQEVADNWFPGYGEEAMAVKENRQAFWGIFQTILKHHIADRLKIDFMNSSCKDNKDRGGALSSIDEAVRNALLNRHDSPEHLEKLTYNALAPFMIKLEEIIDSKRLEYLVSVLNHVNKLSSNEEHIRQAQAKTPIKVTEQRILEGPRPAAVAA